MTRREWLVIGACFGAGALLAADVALLRPEAPAAWAVARGLGGLHALAVLAVGQGLSKRRGGAGVHVRETGPVTGVRLPRTGPVRAGWIVAIVTSGVAFVLGGASAVMGQLPESRLSAALGILGGTVVTLACGVVAYAIAARRAAIAGDDLVLDKDAGTLRVPAHAGTEELLVLLKQVAGAGVQIEAARDDYGKLSETYVVTLRVSRAAGKLTDVPLLRFPRDRARALALAEWLRERLQLREPTREVRGPTTWRAR